MVYVTFPDLATARTITTALVKAKLAACGNIFKLDSVYAWQGRIEHAAEYGALIKIRAGRYRKVEAFVKRRHPYRVPEIISWAIKRGSRAYLNWIKECTA